MDNVTTGLEWSPATIASALIGPFPGVTSCFFGLILCDCVIAVLLRFFLFFFLGGGVARDMCVCVCVCVCLSVCL